MDLGFVAGFDQIEENPTQYVSNFGPTKVNEKDKTPGMHCAGIL